MRRFTSNRVDPADDIEYRSNTFDNTGRHYETPPGRSQSVNEDVLYTNDDDYSRTLHTVRRARSLHRNAQNNTVTFLPSRHVTNIGAAGNKIPGMEVPLLDDEGNDVIQVEHIVQQMEKVDTLMEDTPDGEQMRLDALRDLPQSLTIKRNIRAKITASVSRKSKRKPIGFFKRTQYRFSFWKKKMKQNFRNMIFSLELWYESMKIVQGQYGSGVATYFLFLRWLFIMNTVLSLILISFIVIPQILATGSSAGKSFTFWDLFTGQGSFTESILFYGFYSTKIIDPMANVYYNIPYAYFFTMLVLYVGTFIILSVKVAKSYRASFIETQGGFKNVYANKIFCGWDFGIATPQAAVLKSRSIYKELTELLSDSEKEKEDETLSIKCRKILIKILIHCLCVGVLWSTGTLMVTLMPDYVSSSSNGLLTPVVVSLLMVALPPVFSFLARYEHYDDPRTTIFITLLRTFTLEVVIIAILVVYWILSALKCWETSLAQEIYRLIIFDFLFAVVVLPILILVRCLISKKCWAKLDVPEFDIAQNTLGLIYNQTLLWMGLFFSPLLGLIVTVKMFIMFYVKYLGVKYTYKPSNKSWRASQTHTYFLFLIFIALFLIILIYGYIIMQIKIGGCGPFRNAEYLHTVIFQEILRLQEGSQFVKVIVYFTQPGVIALVLIAMCVAAYYLRAKAMAQKGMVKILRHMLVLQSKDKEFLLNAIANVVQGHWIYSEREDKSSLLNRHDSSLIGNSSTWKYSKETDNMRTPSNANYKLNVTSPKRYEPPRPVTPQSPASPKPSSSAVNRRTYENVELKDRATPSHRY